MDINNTSLKTREAVEGYRQAVKNLKSKVITPKQALINKLKNTCLFEDDTIKYIVNTCGKFSMGNAVIACEILGIKLIGNDVDIMFS